MKKILYSIFAIMIIAACSKDTLDTSINNQDLSAEIADDTQGTYKGIFTTDNADYRGVVQINLPTVSDNTTFVSARAMLSLSEGNVEIANAKETITLDNGFSQTTFANDNLSFDLTVDENGKNPSISNITYRDLSSTMVVANHSERAPVVPIVGTWICTNCNSHPNVNMGSTQTFSMMSFTNASGDSSFTTMATLGGTTYTGIGVQDSCAADGVTTVCAVNSGDGTTTTDGFTVNGNPVTWTGDHTFNNEATGPNDCSGVAGTWSWMSNSYGLLSGTFVSDDSCFNLLYSEDFETFDGSGFSPAPAVGQLDSDIVIVTGMSDGSLAYGGIGVTGDFARGTDVDGGVTTGGVYAFDVNSGNIILGVQPGGSDFTPGTFEFKVNNPGADLSTVSISYHLMVNNDEGRSSTFNVSYSVDNGVSFTPVPALDYTSPTTADSSGFVTIPMMENVPATVLTGNDILIRFSSNDAGGSGSRDEFGLDNIVIQGY